MTTTNKSKRARGRPAKEGLREHLLLNTLQILLRDGYDRFSMNAVAVAANASKETLYRHFHDKTGLLSAALHHLGKAVEPLLMKGIRDDLSRAERLQKLAENYLQGCLRPESLALQRIAYAEGGKNLAPIFTKQFTDTALAVLTRQFTGMGTPKPALDAEIFLAMVRGQIHEKALLGGAGVQSKKKIQDITTHAVRIFSAYWDSEKRRLP